MTKIEWQTITYPEIDDVNIKGALWTFKQWLALKMRVRCGLSIVVLLTSPCKAFSGYDAKYAMSDRQIKLADIEVTDLNI